MKAGVRYNQAKVRHELISPYAAEGLAKVLTYGAEKYMRDGVDGSFNWRRGLSWSETIGSLKRHLIALEKGEDIDAESGLPHIDHLQCNAMFLSEFMKLGTGTDDRWKGKK